ncbi:hypothetical protein GCM10023165_15580 [Variovorax defluvii]|uniref:NAD-dependent epimerase/dehydratase domain-containing protein n=1 Tax=Variovorax defluvii TaxID=913761 RepID=A0ABP8HDQ9_9BURK
MMILIGGRGRLGRALRAARPHGEVVALDRRVYENWWRDDAGPDIDRCLEAAPPGSVMLVAAGVLDPALPQSDHQRVNFELPVRVMERAAAAGLRVVTFGTVMERLVDHPNPYVASKARLGRHVAQRAAAGDAVTHLQIHTLYGGGEPASFMFLGQMCSALRAGRPFEMSPGRQLREYHHVDDDVAAIHAVLATGVDGVLALSHGAPTTLRELALHVFGGLGREELLRLGARPEPPDDNYATVLQRPAVLEGVFFRSARDGVLDHVRSVLGAAREPRA